jgi:hypothetical protein
MNVGLEHAQLVHFLVSMSYMSSILKSYLFYIFYFKGIWEFPLNSHYVNSFDGGYCPFMDQCVLHNLDENVHSIVKLLFYYVCVILLINIYFIYRIF